MTGHVALVMLGLILTVGIIITVILTKIAFWVRDIRAWSAIEYLDQHPPAGMPRHEHTWPPQ
jgi:hypothetical protein